MHSRALRLVLFVLCVIGIVSAAAFLRTSEKTVSSRRAALRAFDVRAREATDALADLRTAQQAYVSIGQGIAFWMPKVDDTVKTVASALAALQQSATSPTSQSALDEAVATLAEFGNVDQRIRGYLESGAQLMAADIVFTEGGEAAVAAARHIEHARLEEHVAIDVVEAAVRKQEMTAAGGAAGFVLLIVAIFALAPVSKRTPVPEAASTSFAHGALPTAPAAVLSDEDLRLRHEDGADAQPAEAPARPAESPRAGAAALALRSAAQICTDIGRVGDPDDLKGLLARAAEVLDASGLVLWLGSPSGTELRPMVAHGYSQDTVSRIPPVPRSANNAAAAAFRSGTLQIVLSRPGSSVKGAIVAPVLAVDGCIGVLSAEIRDGGEASDAVQALAAIFAAQLAGVVAPTAGDAEPRVTGSVSV